MAVELTAAQLTRLRQRPHRTRIWLSIYQPNTVLAARVNQPSIAKGAREVTISILSGDFNSVRRGMTVYIGTTPGGQDIGRIRAIQSTSAVLTLAENATDWVDGWYLTVVAYFEPWAVFPRILLDASNVPQFYKDYDIPYSDQNQYMDPVVCMGPNEAGFIASGCFGVYYSSSGTFGPDGSMPTGYAWNFEGGMPTASALPDPGWVQYTGAGHFLTTLLVTSDNGKSLTAHRHVSIYTRPDEGPRPPLLRWTLKSFEGSRDRGGYAVRFAVRETADFSKVVDGALVVLFTDDWEGGVYGKKSAGAENRDSILFVGYIEDDSISLNPSDHSLEFNAASITNIAERLSGYSATLESKTNAMTWNEMATMTADKAVVHFLRWHSTLTEVADFSPIGDTKQVHFADFERSDVYGAVNGFYQSALLGSVVSDRQGKMWAEFDAAIIPTGSARLTALGAGLELTRQDWRNEIAFGRHGAFAAMAYLELGGLGYAGPYTGTDAAYLAGAPGDVAGYAGSVERSSGLIVAGQDQLNTLVGNAYARANAQFPDIGIPVAGDYRVLDIAPQHRILVDLATTENYRGLLWVNKPFIAHEISYEAKLEDQALLMEVRAHEETNGPPGTTITIPVDPPYDDFDLPDWDIDFPPIIPFPPILPPISPPPGTGDVVYALIDGKLGRTTNFFDASPHWVGVPLTGVTGSFGVNAFFVLDRADPANIAMIGTLVGGAGHGPQIFRTGNLSITGSSPTWSQVWGDAETDSVIGNLGGTQRAFTSAPEQRDDGVWHMLAQRASLAALQVYCYGSVGGWTGVPIGSAVGNGQVSQWNNIVQKGTVLYAAAYVGRLMRNNSLGIGQANWTTQRTDTNPGSSIQCLMSPSASANIIMWQETTNNVKYSDAGGADLNPPSIALFYNGQQWRPSSRGIDGGQVARPVPGFPGNLYAFLSPLTGSGGLFVVLTPMGMTVRATLPAAGLGPVEVMPLDSQKLATFGRVAANGRIAGSSDGGYTWYDKTGDWASQIAVIGDGSSYTSIKFAYTL